MASKQQRLYSNLSPTQKKALALDIAKRLKNALEGEIGTEEDTVGALAEVVRATGSDSFVDDISDAKENGVRMFPRGLRNALISDYSYGDRKNIVNAFGYATPDTELTPLGNLLSFTGTGAGRFFRKPAGQAKEAQMKGLDLSKANFKSFGNRSDLKLDELPEFVGDSLSKVAGEKPIPSFFGSEALTEVSPANVGASDMSYTPGTERQMFKSPAVQPTPEGTGAGEGEGKKSLQQKLQKKAQRQREKTRILQEKSAQLDAKSILNQKKSALKAQKDEAKRLENMKKRRALLKQGYAGGVDQYDYDQQILKGTRLGDTDSEGKFRLRSPEQVEARIREGQYNLSRPMRKALQEGAQAATAARQFAEDIAPAGQSKEDRELAMQNALRQSMIGPRPAGINRKAITSPDMTGTQLRKGEDPAARDQRKWSESRGNKRIQVGGGDGGDDTPGSSVTELRDASGNVVGYSASKGVSKDQVGAASPDLADFQNKRRGGGGDFNEWRRKRKAEEDRKKTLQAEYAKKAEQNK